MRHDQVDPRLIALVEELKPTSARNPKLAAHGRAQFLAQAVSLADQQRHSRWTIFQQKEKFAMKLVMSMLVIVGLLFGGNATVSAAQNTLPNEVLYPVKLISEDVHLWFISDPIQQTETLMQQAQTRIEEIVALMSNGIVPPSETTVRAQERIQRALRIAARLEGTSQTMTLQQIQARLRSQEQLVDQVQPGTCADCAPLLQRTRDMLRSQMHEVEDQLPTPEPLQNQDQNQFQNQTQTQHPLQVTQTPLPADGIFIPKATCTPALDGTGQQNGGGNLSAATPMQQNQQKNQDGTGSQGGMGPGSGNNPSPGSGGPGGKP